MIYRVVICDDRSEDRNRLKRLLEECTKDKMDLKIVEFRTGEQMLSRLEEGFHVVFLDIHLDEDKMGGYEIAQEIRKKDQNVVLVFYTDVAQPTVACIRVHPFLYMIKSQSDRMLKRDIAEIMVEMKDKVKKHTLWIHCRSANYNIYLDEVLYIEKYRRGMTRIYTTKSFLRRMRLMDDPDRVFSYSIPLEEVYEMIQEYGFEYAHGSYIVNLIHVSSFERTNILVKGISLSLARSKTHRFQQRMVEFLGKDVKAGR